MSDFPANGELCRLVRPCSCGNGSDVLNYHFAAEYAPAGSTTLCGICGAEYDEQMVVWPFTPPTPGRETLVPLTWLRRVPPLSELEDSREPVYIYA